MTPFYDLAVQLIPVVFPIVCSECLWLFSSSPAIVRGRYDGFGQTAREAFRRPCPTLSERGRKLVLFLAHVEARSHIPWRTHEFKRATQRSPDKSAAW